MDPKKKKIYIGIIVVCFTASAAIVGWTLFGNKDSAPPPVDGPANAINFDPNALQQGGSFAPSAFQAPVVFPGSSEFNSEVLESSEFVKLKPFTPVDIAGQTGRPDPFRTY